MARRLLAYLLIVALVASNFSHLFLYAGFKLNRNYIASKLCENRDKPWMHCNGKCYFMKKIKQAQEKERNDERQSQKNLFQDAFFPAAADVKFHVVLLRIMFIPGNGPKLPKTNTSIFRPPQIA